MLSLKGLSLPIFFKKFATLNCKSDFLFGNPFPQQSTTHCTKTPSSSFDNIGSGPGIFLHGFLNRDWIVPLGTLKVFEASFLDIPSLTASKAFSRFSFVYFFLLIGLFTSFGFLVLGGSEKRKDDEMLREPNYQHAFDPIISTMLTNGKCSFSTMLRFRFRRYKLLLLKKLILCLK